MRKGSLPVAPQPPDCCTYRPPRKLDDPGALGDLCKALGDRSRLQMLQLLASAERALCVCELESQFELSQPTISHHLKVLREAGLVRAERRGTWVFYALDPGPLELLRWFDKLLPSSRSAERKARPAITGDRP